MVGDAYLRDMQKRNTGHVIERKKSDDPGNPDSIIVSFPSGNRSFANLAEMNTWATENYGVVNAEDGSRLCGNTIEELHADGKL